MTMGVATALSMVFVSVASALGLGLSLVAWTIFRGSPFGRTIGVLSVFMLLLTVYHPLLLLFPSASEMGLAMESVAFSLLVVFAGLTVRQHRRLSRRPVE